MQRTFCLFVRVLSLWAFGLACVVSFGGCRQAQTPAVGQAPRNTAVAPRTVRKVANAPTTSPVLYVEPDAGFNWLYAAVNGAQRTLDMTMYELADTTLSGDLVAACARGVRVRVLLDQSLEKQTNTPAYAQLNGAGPNCSATWSNLQFGATHQKSLVLDGASAVVLTANLASRYYSQTRDFAVVDRDPADVAAMEATFNSDFGSSTDFSYQPPAGDALLWSPTTAQAGLLGVINGAKRTLLVENEEMGAPVIVSALEAACRRGVTVAIAMTDTNAAYHPNYTALESAGCGVHLGANNPATLYVHAKAMVADAGTAAQAGYVGSINFSNASMTRNRELGLLLQDPVLLGQIASTISGDYANFPTYP